MYNHFNIDNKTLKLKQMMNSNIFPTSCCRCDGCCHDTSLLVLFFVSTKSVSVSVLGLFIELRLILANKKNRERGTWF